jgi:hypothetical protein
MKDKNAYHIPSQYELLIITKLLLQLRLCKRPRELLPNGSFALLRRKLVKLLRQLRAWSEHWRSFRSSMADVYDLALAICQTNNLNLDMTTDP